MCHNLSTNKLSKNELGNKRNSMINGDIAGMVDRLIIRDSQPLHNSTYEIDGTPSDNGEEEYGKLEIDSIAKNIS